MAREGIGCNWSTPPAQGNKKKEEVFLGGRRLSNNLREQLRREKGGRVEQGWGMKEVETNFRRLYLLWRGNKKKI